MQKRVFIFLVLLIHYSCNVEEELSSGAFESLSPATTGVDFNNQVIDQPDFNILEYLYFYNGGGVATGDLNNDGLPDIYFTSNMGSDQLYFNKGDFQFENVSHLLPAADIDGWSTGVTLVDINHDGWLDIYVCKLGQYKIYKDSNKLFINQNGQKFTEAASQYGLDFSGFATQAAFLDYDRDGDLDCYLLNHSVKSPEQFKPALIRNKKDSLAGDKLLENIDGNFQDVTDAAGIYSSSVGFGLGIDIADLNGDGWLDIYIGNDFHENDYLYINQKDKTFKEVISSATGHTSNFSMGCAIADINNDLKPDILSLDMKPFDEVVYKKSGGWESIEIYNFKRRYGYHHQSPRNALQINLGTEDWQPQFSERAAYYGLEATDWSWSPLIYDFDNDGDKDIYITNGILRRPNDMDFVNFHFKANTDQPIQQLNNMPTGAVPNIYFENKSEAQAFEKKPAAALSLSTGAAVADFDLDGRLDVVVNNLNAPASILRNNTIAPDQFFVQIKLEGMPENTFGLGARIILYSDGGAQETTIKSSSGFQSYSEPIAHFGLTNKLIDSLQVIWPDGSVQTEKQVGINMRHSIKKRNSNTRYTVRQQTTLKTARTVVNYHHQENNYNDQQSNKWLLYNQSAFGPRMTTIDEQHFYVSGNANTASGLVNTSTDHFSPLIEKTITSDEQGAGVLNFNGQAHFYVTVGGNELKTNNKGLADKLYRIETSGQWVEVDSLIPDNFQHTATCQSNDYDKDGDEDIFVGVHSYPGSYGMETSSYLHLNEGDHFGQRLLDIQGMVYDATWADIDNNGFDDLIAVGHWMEITILYNLDGENFEKYTISESSGLWNCVYVDDVDKDGKLDIIAGNYGLNHPLKASQTEPMRYYLHDFDNNGQDETLITYFTDGREVPYTNQMTTAAQIPGIKKKFLKNERFAQAAITDIFKPELLKQSVNRKIVEFSSCYFLQVRPRHWTKNALPANLQMAPIFAIEKSVDQVYFFGGNWYEIDPNWGRQDASHLSAYSFEGKQWEEQTKKLRLPLVKGPIRDLLIQNKKLYIAINNVGLQVIDLE